VTTSEAYEELIRECIAEMDKPFTRALPENERRPDGGRLPGVSQ
jgi:hypothetical protein